MPAAALSHSLRLHNGVILLSHSSMHHFLVSFKNVQHFLLWL